MSKKEVQTLVDDGTLEFTLGNTERAIEILNQALEKDKHCYNAWLALAEVYLSEKDPKKALEAAEKAHKISPNELHINTTLSRIWVEIGDKDKAEHFGAQVRMISWKDELKNPPPTS